MNLPGIKTIRYGIEHLEGEYTWISDQECNILVSLLGAEIRVENGTYHFSAIFRLSIRKFNPDSEPSMKKEDALNRQKCWTCAIPWCNLYDCPFKEFLPCHLIKTICEQIPRLRSDFCQNPSESDCWKTCRNWLVDDLKDVPGQEQCIDSTSQDWEEYIFVEIKERRTLMKGRFVRISERRGEAQTDILPESEAR